MNLRPMLISNTGLIAAMSALSAWAWDRIPDGASLPVHYGLDGTPDRFGSKAEALIVIPILAVGITILLWTLPRFDPRRENIEASGKFWNVVSIAVVALLTYLQGLMILAATGHIDNLMTYLVPGLSVMFMVIGNYLSKTRSNWFGGIRTPWTMSSDYSWNRTHRIAGTLFILSGLGSLATWVVAGSEFSFVVLMASLAGSALLSVILSYVFWRQDPERESKATSP
ncbi:MAG: SdpI family protein [Micropepsaceae bacterium]